MRPPIAPPDEVRNRRLPRAAWLPGLLLVLISGVSCRSIAPLKAVDLSVPGWRVQQGQAVWQPDASKAELAGELLLATNTTGDCLVQFTKTPLSIVTAQAVDGSWEIVFGGADRAWRGRGAPPGRLVWFQLSRALAGEPLARGWEFRASEDPTWRLENRHTGESLEGYLFR